MQVQVYLAKARDFSRGMTLANDDAEYRYSSALLAIHCAISYADALRFGLGSDNLSGDDHRKSPAAVRKLLVERNYDKKQGLRHLEKLVANKTFVSYTGDVMTEEESKSIFDHALRFVGWAEEVGRDLKIERWRDDLTE